MENQPLTTNQQFEKLPNATAVLILGICSILFGCVFVGYLWHYWLGVVQETYDDVSNESDEIC